MTVTYGAPDNPEFSDSDGWTCVLRYANRQMTIPFYMGRGHNGAEPEVSDVLDCLFSDADGVDGVEFEDWASDYGYDTDSRKAERVYAACRRTRRHLLRLLGEDYGAISLAVHND